MRRLRNSRRHPVSDETERPEGIRVLTPTLRKHSLYRLPGDVEAYQVWHGSILDVSAFHAELAYLVENYATREEEEDRTIAALASGDPLAPCRLGWHRTDTGGWFSLANGGRRGKLIVYWIGSQPFQCACRSLMSVAGVSIVCRLCRTDVDATTPRLDDRS